MNLFKVRVRAKNRLFVGWVYAKSQRQANALGRARL